MAEIELTDDQTERIEAIRAAALVGTAEQMQAVRHIMAQASRRRSRQLLKVDLLAAEKALGISSS